MATPSITASNAAAPFSTLLNQDSNFAVSASWAGTNSSGVSPSVNFKVSTPYPTVENTIVYVYASGVTSTSSSLGVTLQESADNTTWNNVAAFASPLISATGSTTPNISVILTPTAKQYLRVSGSGIPGTNATGSFGLAVLF